MIITSLSQIDEIPNEKAASPAALAQWLSESLGPKAEILEYRSGGRSVVTESALASHTCYVSGRGTDGDLPVVSEDDLTSSDEEQYDAVILTASAVALPGILNTKLPILVARMKLGAPICINIVTDTKVGYGTPLGLKEAQSLQIERFYGMSGHPEGNEFPYDRMADYGLTPVSVLPWKPNGLDTHPVAWLVSLKTDRLVSVEQSAPKIFSASNTLSFLSSVRDNWQITTDMDTFLAGTGRALLKHDLHHDFQRTLNMARAEAEASVKGVYFVLHAHPLTASYYDTPEFWDGLKEIQDLGHIIGLHLDITYILRTGSTFIDFVRDLVAEFREHGLEPRFANAHGDSGTTAKGASPMAIFKDFPKAAEAHRERLTDQALIDLFEPHIGRYSLAEVEEIGLQAWMDSAIYHRGEAVSGVKYLSDNSTILRYAKRSLGETPFEIDLSEVETLNASREDSNLLVLLHPQWFGFDRKTSEGWDSPAERMLSFKVKRGFADPKRTDVAPAIVPVAEADPKSFPEERHLDGKVHEVRLAHHKLKYDFAFRAFPGETDRLLVAFHGGTRGATKLPVFARITQGRLFGAHVLSVFDPILYENPILKSGWFIGRRDEDAIKHIAEVVETVAGNLNCTPVMIGNSGGGFAAPMVASHMSGGRFISVNGALDVHQVQPNGRDQYFEHIGYNPEDANVEMARLSVSERFNAMETPPQGVFIYNTSDAYNYQNHFLPMADSLGLPQIEQADKDARIASYLYDDGSNRHNAETPDVLRWMAVDGMEWILR